MLKYLTDAHLQTHSNTEVILKPYQKLGSRSVELLDGMFAFAIIQSDELFMARDPLIPHCSVAQQEYCKIYRVLVDK